MIACVMPCRTARNGMLFTSEGTINIKNQKWRTDFSTIDPNGTSFVDSVYSKDYLRHLFAANEILGKQIATLHNLGFSLWLVKVARNRIIDSSFYDWNAIMVKK